MSDRLHNKGGGDGGRNGTQATVAWHGMAWHGLEAPHSYEYSKMSRGGPMRTVESQQQINNQNESNDKTCRSQLSGQDNFVESILMK